MSSIELSRLRANLKLSVNRLKLLQQKNSALAKQNRRTLAKLLEDGKIESARIRIENIIQEDIHLELLESLEIYSELVMARCSLIHGPRIPDQRLDEALHVLLYTAQFITIKELSMLKPLVAHLTSKEYVQDAVENKEAIPPKILSRIHVDIPKSELVDLYMLEIAKAYNVDVPGVYTPPEEDTTEPAHSNETSQSGNEGGAEKKSEVDDIWARFAALKK